MNFIKKKFGLYPIGVWIALIALILTLLAWMMQAYSLFDWEGAKDLGIQVNSFIGDKVELALANVERGVALADMFWAFPITIVAIIGLIMKKFFGFIAAMMEFAICIYFPLFFAFQNWTTAQSIALVAIFLWAIPSVLGIASLWMNRKYFNY